MASRTNQTADAEDPEYNVLRRGPTDVRTPPVCNTHSSYEQLNVAVLSEPPAHLNRPVDQGRIARSDTKMQLLTRLAFEFDGSPEALIALAVLALCG